MTFDLLLVLVDFGLVVLIWMIQLVVYPSFDKIDEQLLLKWHSVYTRRISTIVMPLMTAQLVLHSMGSFRGITNYKLTGLFVVLFMWLITFLVFVPLHSKISRGDAITASCKRLVKYNWWRTAGWTLVFLLSFMSFL